MIQVGEYITPKEVAIRLKLKPTTIRQWLGRLSEADGVFRFGSRCTRIDWAVFEARFRSRKLGSKS